VRIGLLTEGGYPYVSGDAGLWCDRLVRGLGQHEFDLYALSRSERQEAAGQVELPPQVRRVRTAPLWTAGDDGVAHGRRARRRFAECYGELVAVLCEGVSVDASEDRFASQADRFGNALYGLTELARDEGGLVRALRSEGAVRALERACRAPGALRTAREARVPELLAVAAHLERLLRPLSLDWYEDDGADGADGLGSVDLCHAASGGAAALTGLVARHLFGVPLVVTEYGVRLRTHYLSSGGGAVPSASSSSSSSSASSASEPAPAVRALLAAFHGRLAAEVYRQAACVTPGNAHARRWQERCGADRAKLRTVYPGMDASRFAEVGEAPDTADPHTLVWVGRVEPAKDLVSLLHAFAEIRKEEPGTRLRIIGAPAGSAGEEYLGHCRMLAAQLFPDEADGPHSVGDNPVSFEEIGGPEVPGLAEAYASGAVVVLSSVVEGFPVGLVEAMLCGRATVSTDVGAVVEVIGGTGLVVPPRNPRALAEACVALLRDPERRARLGAAARARALELFTVEQNVAAFHGIYLEIVSRSPVRRVVLDKTGEPLPFAVPAEAWLAGRCTGPGERVTAAGRGGGWAAEPPVRGTSAVPGTSPVPGTSAVLGASTAPVTSSAHAEAPVVATEGAR
jgi:glycosyltransferase involved in cell wall biosynthesis